MTELIHITPAAQHTARVRDLAASRQPLIAVHRGMAGGLVHENTPTAAIAAIASGADIVEFDVIRSSDGRFYVFHDGYEPLHFKVNTPLPGLDSDQIDGLRYHLHPDESEPEGVTTLSDMLGSLPDGIFNVDRAWRYWDTLLPILDDFEMADRLVLKCPPEERWLRLLADHPVKYPLIPMVRTPDQVEHVLAHPGLATIGVELLAQEPDHPFLSQGYVASLHARGVLAFANAINLENRIPLFAGYDDETSLRGRPDDGWGRLIDLGIDIIQTDWPALLAHYLGRSLPFPVRDR